MLFKRLHHHCLIQRFTLSIDGPQVPLNLTVYSDKNGKVHMTWLSGFNGGLDQFFVISRKNGPQWDYVGNLTDPGNGSELYFEAGSPTPGRKNSFRVESCNIFNCTAQYVELNSNLKGMLYFFYFIYGRSIVKNHVYKNGYKNEYFQWSDILFTTDKQSIFIKMFKSKTRKKVNSHMLCFIIALVVI